MHRKIILAVAALLLSASLAGTATAKPVSRQWERGFTLGYSETQTDLAGRVVATHSQDDIAPGTTVGSPLAETAPFACCSPSGCDTVDAYVTKKDTFGIYVVWRYHQAKHWCWSYPRITTVSVGAHFSNVDGTSSVVNYYDNGYGWYYTWAGSSVGGHYSFRQGSISNCIFKIGCLGTAYPQIEIWVNGNGAWTWRGKT